MTEQQYASAGEGPMSPPESTVDPTATAEAAARRAAFIQGLRDCADFLESHPSVRQPQYAAMNVFINTREEMAAQAKAATWEKIYNGEWFYLRREFGEDLSLDITTPRSTVCRRVVTGTQEIEAQPARTEEVVEWVCDDVSLLATRGE